MLSEEQQWEYRKRKCDPEKVDQPAYSSCTGTQAATLDKNFVLQPNCQGMEPDRGVYPVDIEWALRLCQLCLDIGICLGFEGHSESTRIHDDLNSHALSMYHNAGFY